MKHGNYMPVTLGTHGNLNGYSCAELEGDVIGLFVLINATFLAYKQLSINCSPVITISYTSKHNMASMCLQHWQPIGV